MEDLKYSQLLAYIAGGEVPQGLSDKPLYSFRRSAKPFCASEDGLTLLYKHDGRPPARVVRVGERAIILKRMHEDDGAHFGQARTYDSISQLYFWPGMTRDIREYVRQCDVCQRQGTLPKRAPELHPIPVNHVLETIGIDLVGPFDTSSDGNQYIVVCTEYLTKWVEAKAIPNKRATTVGRFLVDNVVFRYGIFTKLISDQGTEFCNTVVGEVLSILGIQHAVSSAYHPQTNGLTERFNRTLCTQLRKLKTNRTDWDCHIGRVLFAYNTGRQKSTGESPFRLMFGRDPRLPMELVLPSSRPERPIATTDELVRIVRASDERTVGRIRATQEAYKDRHDKRQASVAFPVGSQVLRMNPRKIGRHGAKLDDVYIGPYTIHEGLGKGTFRLTDASGKVLGRAVSGHHLVEYAAAPQAEVVVIGSSSDDVLSSDSVRSGSGPEAAGTASRDAEHALYSGTTIHESSIARLDCGAWVNDELINAATSLIPKRAGVLILQTHWYQTLEVRIARGDSVLRMARGLLADKPSMVLLPINTSGCHWIAAAIDLPSREIVLYDPMGRRDDQVAGTLSRHVAAELEPKSDRNWTTRWIQGPRQRDGSSCGLFVVEWIRSMATGEAMESVDAVQGRRAMEALIRGGIV